MLDFLRSCHKRAPFLFFNGNTFADIGRAMTDNAFGDLLLVRRRELTSTVAHFIAGVLDRESMVEIIESLAGAAEFKPGDRVKTFRGSARGVVIRIAADGRVVWKADGSESELLASAASLLPD